MKPLNVIMNLRYLDKLYNKMSKPVYSKYGITKIEMDIIAFVANNPEENTAKEIVDYRMLTKSHVSSSLDALEKSGYVSRSEDEKDKRIDRITLLPICDPIVKDVRKMQKDYSKVLTEGLEADELSAMTKTISKIVNNAKEYWNQ